MSEGNDAAPFTKSEVYFLVLPLSLRRRNPKKLARARSHGFPPFCDTKEYIPDMALIRLFTIALSPLCRLR
jgi:hypothetical protein